MNVKRRADSGHLEGVTCPHQDRSRPTVQVLRHFENAGHERGAQIRQLNRATFLPAHPPRAERALPIQGRSGERTGGVPSGYVEDSFDVRTKLGALFSCRSKYRMLKTVVRP